MIILELPYETVKALAATVIVVGLALGIVILALTSLRSKRFRIK